MNLGLCWMTLKFVPVFGRICVWTVLCLDGSVFGRFQVTSTTTTGVRGRKNEMRGRWNGVGGGDDLCAPGLRQRYHTGVFYDISNY